MTDPKKPEEQLPEVTATLFYQEPDDVILPVEEPEEDVSTDDKSK